MTLEELKKAMDEYPPLQGERKEKLEFTAEHHKEALKMLSGDDLMKLKYKREYDDGFRYLVRPIFDGDTKRYCFYEHQMKDYPGIKWNIREDGSLDAYETLNCDDPTDPDYYECEGGELINLIKDIIGKDGWTGYCQGNIIKYVVRARDKNGVEDLEKAKVYLDFLINGGLK